MLTISAGVPAANVSFQHILRLGGHPLRHRHFLLPHRAEFPRFPIFSVVPIVRFVQEQTGATDETEAENPVETNTHLGGAKLKDFQFVGNVEMESEILKNRGLVFFCLILL